MSTEMTGMQALASRSFGEPKTAEGARYLSFGSFTVDLKREELFKDGNRIKLPGKVYQTLVALLERPGEVVSRDDLRMKLWPEGTYVNYDANVNTTVNKLRLALGDSPDQPVYVETIPRQGYSFVGKVTIGAPEGIPRREGNAASAIEPAELVGAPKAQNAGARPILSKWFVAGVVALVLSGMFFGAAAVLYLHRVN
ncbi:MAG TPA: winged helix-turn-helix domain-containing protein [Candidatus Acidoferrum sp.]|nr:winged helix-turn-helix domain-containing protein [Candidatus Acidoferrum sp.]